ncbi:uracil DNA glycosylase [Rhodotorula kratochvilovae]
MSKRQLGLAEAFLNAQGASVRAAVPPAKRARRSASPRTSEDAKTLSTASSAGEPVAPAPAQALNKGEASSSPQTTDAAPAFSPTAFLSSLSTSSSPSEADLLALECATLDPSWLAHLQEELRKPYFLDLKRFLWKEGLRGTQDREGGKLRVFPPARDVYAWSRYTPLQDVKVVILGQDPYHDDGQAHGLCFSVRPGVKIPPSLRNIYKEIKEEYPAFEVPKHGNLISLARSGVLLLNTSLTVAPHKAGSHSNKGWETFTEKVVALVDQHGGGGEGVVVLAWGQWAAKRVAGMDKKKHLILTSAHPSPLSARRGFFGNGHFKKANEWLLKRHGENAQIDWTTLEPEEDEAGLDKV